MEELQVEILYSSWPNSDSNN